MNSHSYHADKMTLTEYSELYASLMESSNGYRDQMRWAISRFEQWVGDTVKIGELTEDMINKYLAYTKEKLKPQTRLSRRNMLLRLWRHAANNVRLRGRPRMPNRDLIVKVRKKGTTPTAWSVDEVAQLLNTADKLRGLYDQRISKRLYWRAYILTAWSSGLRRVDIVGLRRCDITQGGKVAVLQAKTGRYVVGKLSAEAIAAIQELVDQHGQTELFPEWCIVPTWRKIAKRIVARAGISGSIGRLRHSAGTAVESAFPGKGHQFLGNTESVFQQHYYDRRHDDNLPNPPPLIMRMKQIQAME